MEKEILTTAMKNSISEVLETMFFLPIDFPDAIPSGDLWASVKDDIMTARLNFNGPFSGYCVCCIPKKLAVSIVADFSGKDEESVSDDDAAGIVLEITNMIVGGTLSNYDEKAIFNLEIPEHVKFKKYKKFSDSEKKIFIVLETLEDHMAFQMVIN